MSESNTPQSNEKNNSSEMKKQLQGNANQQKDSFNVPVQKSPWLVYALLQIPIVIIMVIIVYFMYQSRNN